MSTALVIDASLLRNLKPQVHAALLLAKNQDSGDFATAIPITAGSGAPSHNAAVINEIYIRTDASDSDLLIYRAVNTSGSWEAVIGSELTDILAATNAWTATNTFSHATGVTTDTLTERTSGAGVTADGLLIKDGGIVLVDAAGSPAVEGRLAYNADHLEYHDGTAARIVLDSADIGVGVQAYSAVLAWLIATNSVPVQVTLTPAAESGNAIAVAIQIGANSAPIARVQRLSCRLYDASMLEALVAAWTMAETGAGAEVSTTARPALLIDTNGNGAAQVTVTDVSGVFAGTVYLEVTPENSPGSPSIVPLTFA